MTSPSFTKLNASSSSDAVDTFHVVPLEGSEYVGIPYSEGRSGSSTGASLGVDDGVELGVADGLALGLADGDALGLADGLADGLAEGVALPSPPDK